MKKYMVPELEIKNFEVEDVIMTSSNPASDPYYNADNLNGATLADQSIEYGALFNLN